MTDIKKDIIKIYWDPDKEHHTWDGSLIVNQTYEHEGLFYNFVKISDQGPIFETLSGFLFAEDPAGVWYPVKIVWEGE